MSRPQRGKATSADVAPSGADDADIHSATETMQSSLVSASVLLQAMDKQATLSNSTFQQQMEEQKQQWQLQLQLLREVLFGTQAKNLI